KFVPLHIARWQRHDARGRKLYPQHPGLGRSHEPDWPLCDRRRRPARAESASACTEARTGRSPMKISLINPSAALLLPAGAAAAAPVPMPNPALNARAVAQAPARPTLLLRGLDKITGRAFDIVAPLNTPVKFATLTVTAHYCYSTPPSETPETAAFVQIMD